MKDNFSNRFDPSSIVKHSNFDHKSEPSLASDDRNNGPMKSQKIIPITLATFPSYLGQNEDTFGIHIGANSYKRGKKKRERKKGRI